MPAFFAFFFVMMVAAALMLLPFLMLPAAASVMMVLLEFSESLIEIGSEALYRDGDLLLAGEVLDLNEVLAKVVFAGNHGEFRIGSHRFLE